ncbi:DMT family transporter [Candidatus Peregrinibacteria bacterium]|nr:DMT family transporter [Candidatus Peregrinibacteria bacterium]
MQQNSKKILIGYVCAVSASFLWGFHSVAIRWLIKDGVNPFLIGDLRLLIGSAALALTVLIWDLAMRKPVSSLCVPYSKFFWLIAISLAANFLFFHKGLEYTIASDAILLEAFSPVMVLLIMMIFIPQRIHHLIKHPELPKRVIQTVIIGSIGSALLLINDPKDILTASSVKLMGDVIEFVAMIAWALVLLSMHEYQQREKNHNSLAATAQFLFFAGLFLAPFVPWIEVTKITGQEFFWIMVLGIGSTSMSYSLWHVASKYLDIFPLLTIFNLASIFTVITESMVLGLKVSWTLLIGGAFILYAAMKAKLINSQYRIMEEKEQMEPHNP